MSRLLSDRVKKIPSTKVSADRYEFLKLSEAEPDLGTPEVEGYVLTSSLTGERSWVPAVSVIEAPGDNRQLLYNNNGSVDGTASLVYNSITGNLGLGVETPSAKLDVAGDIKLNSSVKLNSLSVSSSTTDPTPIAGFDYTVYGGAKFIVQVHDTITNARHLSEFLVTHNAGTNPIATEYGVLYTGSGPLATFEVDILAGNLRLLATNASLNQTVYKIFETLFVS